MMSFKLIFEFTGSQSQPYSKFNLFRLIFAKHNVHYWRVMKKRLKDEGNETVTNCNGLKMLANEGKR